MECGNLRTPNCSIQTSSETCTGYTYAPNAQKVKDINVYGIPIEIVAIYVNWCGI